MLRRLADDISWLNNVEQTGKMTELHNVADCFSQAENGSSTDDVDEEFEALELKAPYYLANFLAILTDVTSDNSQFRAILTNNELALVNTFQQSLSINAQKLYVRLFLRKAGWLLTSKIKYADIAGDISTLTDELRQTNFLEDSLTNSSLPEVLALAPNNVLKDLCKQYALKFTAGEDARQALATLACKQKTIWGSTLEGVMKKKVKKLLGGCVRVRAESRECFARIMALFSLTTSTFDSLFELNSTSVADPSAAGNASKSTRSKRSGGGIHPVYGLLLVNMGSHKYFPVEISVAHPIFPTRAHLERFEHAQSLELLMFDAWSASRNISVMRKICLQAVKLYNQYDCAGILADDDKQPLHLRRMTAGWRLIRVIEIGIEALQRAAFANKKNGGAVEVVEIGEHNLPIMDVDDDNDEMVEMTGSGGIRKIDKHAAIEAIDILTNVLLKQTRYCAHHRGDWYDRLALIYERYHPDSATIGKEQALQVTKNGLGDRFIRSNQRLMLQTRAARLQKSIQNNAAQQRSRSLMLKKSKTVQSEAADNNSSLPEVNKLTIVEAPKIYIQGRKLPQFGSKSIFVRVEEDEQHRQRSSLSSSTTTTEILSPHFAAPSPTTRTGESNGTVTSSAAAVVIAPQQKNDDTSTTLLCSVEQFTLAHFHDNGYSCGMHAEGSLIRTVIGLTFWDVIFAPLSSLQQQQSSSTLAVDAVENRTSIYCSAFQMAPLDLLTAERDYFYAPRKHLIESRLQQLRCKWTNNDFKDFLRATWEAHYQTMCVFVSWELFQSLDELLAFVDCLELKKFAALCEYFLRDPRCLSAGFPDLMCWNPATSALKIVEVKGPNDTLSAKQCVWLDFLLGAGFDACVCHVRVFAKESNASVMARKLLGMSKRRAFARSSEEKADLVDNDFSESSVKSASAAVSVRGASNRPVAASAGGKRLPRRQQSDVGKSKANVVDLDDDIVCLS